MKLLLTSFTLRKPLLSRLVRTSRSKITTGPRISGAVELIRYQLQSQYLYGLRRAVPLELVGNGQRQEKKEKMCTPERVHPIQCVHKYGADC